VTLESPVLAVRGIGMVFNGSDGRNTVLEDLTLEIQEHDFTAIVGGSGCGKTTLLRIMAGLQKPTAGRVLLEGAPPAGPGPLVSLVFQHYASTLLPWKTALDNVTFGLRGNGTDPRALRARALALLDAMGLAGAAGRYPWELSGGMQQRVTLARALIRKPKVLLLDEPFSAVDEATRAGLQDLLLTLHREESCSIVLVSHNLEEVIHLSRRIVILGGSPSRVESLIETSEDLTREVLRSHPTARRQSDA
jgi:NitT/TauT family transport system ATP-binding protein